MKKILLLLLLAAGLHSQAQFTTAELQATGLTCAMCSNSINKALLKLPYVASVKADIRHSSFHIVFKENTPADIDGIKNAVEGAGFSVGNLHLTGRFNDLRISDNKQVQVGNSTLHFVGVNDAVLDGEKTIQVVDKGFVSAKLYKKFSASKAVTVCEKCQGGTCCAKDGKEGATCCAKDGKAAACCMKDGKPADCCVKDGKGSDCCMKDGMAMNTRVYLVTI